MDSAEGQTHNKDGEGLKNADSYISTRTSDSINEDPHANDKDDRLM